jgi:DNA-binding winged helix-turn-helix (wHTH) protein
LNLLVALLEHAGDVVLRDELRQRLWPGDTFVDFEHGLNAAVKRLRDVLGDSAETPRYIETIPRRGYRLIAVVELEGDGGGTRRAAQFPDGPSAVAPDDDVGRQPAAKRGRTSPLPRGWRQAANAALLVGTAGFLVWAVRHEHGRLRPRRGIV